MSFWVWLAIFVAVALLLLLLPLVNIIRGVLRFILVTERTVLSEKGALSPSKVKRLPGSRFTFIIALLDGGTDRMFRMMSLDGKGQVYPPMICIGGDFQGDAFLYVFDADAVREILTQHDKFFAKMPAAYDVLAPLLGKGLVISSGELWRRQRKLLTPLFHFARLRAYTTLENEEAARLCDALAALNGADVSPVPLFAACMQRIVMRAVFGQRFDLDHMSKLWDQVNDEHAFRIWMALVAFVPLWIARLIPGGVARTFRCLEEVRSIIGGAVDRARAAGEAADDCDDLVGQMAHLDIDRELIIDECVTFLFAGRDTVSHTMGFVSYFLAQHPDVQDELRSEAEGVFNGGDAISDDGIEALKLHAAVVRESLRLRPALPALNRIVSAEEGATLCGVHIPKGTIVTVGAMGVQRASEHWGADSLEFRPSRWFDEGQRNRHAFAWLPFNAATRSCIGKHLATNATAVMLAHIMRRFRIVGDVSNVTAAFTGTFGPVGLKLRFEAR